jgi:hypothetical protein
MSHIDDWAKEKPKHIASIAQISTFITVFVLKFIKSDKPDLLRLLNAKTNINTHNWLGYYLNTKCLFRFLSDIYAKEGGFLLHTANYSNHLLDKLKYLPNNQIYSVKEVFLNNYDSNHPEFIHILNQIYKDTLNEIINLSDREFSDSSRPSEDVKFILPEFVFAFTVLLPSVIIYGEFPSKLYRKARLGNIAALDMLLRIDKTIICDQKISERIFELSLKTNKSDLNRVATALKGKLVGKKTSQKAKFKTAGFISVVSEVLGHRLSAPDIQDLFNALAADRNPLELIDPDLPDSPEAFAKAILRERPFWLRSFGFTDT